VSPSLKSSSSEPSSSKSISSKSTSSKPDGSQPDQGLSRIEKRKLEFRDKITAAALKLFEENGVADTSVASIIKEADIAHKTFFNHFPTKDHLLLHIASTFSENAYGVFKEGFKKKTDPRKRVEYCLLNIAKVLQTVNSHYKELLNFYLISGAGSSDLRRVQQDQFSEVIGQIMHDAKEQELLREDCTVETCTDIVVGICVATLLNWSLDDNYPIGDKMRKQVDFINSSIFIPE